MKPNHKDKRGTITDLVETKDYSITKITFTKGAVRGNHYHRETKQIDILLKGVLDCAKGTKNGKTTMFWRVKSGQEIVHEPFEAHAYEAVEPSEIISICFGVRRGKNYEQDVVRLKEPLL